MLLPRVIPCLLLDRGGLVKTVKFRSPKYVGDPINAIRIFNERRVDELILLDISVGRHSRGPDYAALEEIASECFMPLCYGGGVTTLEQAKRIVNIGVEKIAINSAALSRLDFVHELSVELGSQSVVASIDVKKDWFGRYRVFDCTKRATTNLDPLRHAEALVALGAGEVLLTSVDRDGTQVGYDGALVQQFTERLGVPVVACGGASTPEHLKSVIKESGASAAAAGSMFVFQGPHRAVLISYPPYSELVCLLGN